MGHWNDAFKWERQPEAEGLILKALDIAERQNPMIAKLKESLRRGCSTGLMEWIDHISVPKKEWEGDVKGTGFTQNGPFYRHKGAQLPDVQLWERHEIEVAVSVDSIAEFLEVRGIKRKIEGAAFGGYRHCEVDREGGVILSVVERRGVNTVQPIKKSDLDTYFACKEMWMTRNRLVEKEEEELEEAISLAEHIAKKMGKDAAACLILECERQYWQAKNSAGQLQKNRQDRLGMGWANHDHHTFRSSRQHFSKLVKLFEVLGFHCRERFYAGEEAGWGAQVMENSTAKLVLFLDVDLSPEEIEIDFAHEMLPKRQKLGTIGLWCALHGDSILHAGMHHLELQFDHNQLTEDLKHVGIRMMDPFSNFSYLKQAFTQGEIWHVAPERIHILQQEGSISPEQAEQFKTHGAIGSHMENLQRKEGYKGFNQKNVSFIIKRTDPRHATLVNDQGAA